ncbi:MAG: menaquinone biosynthesis protein [Verrucomicrobia bacterium]|nr:menaquinone biosynthesis protein [Verrucomicrobiota bacterium]
MNPKGTPELRIVPLETPEELAAGIARGRRDECRQREEALEDNALAPYRVGSVPYLNAVPLTRGLERQLVFAPPSRLASLLQRRELDAALVSTTEVLFNEGYDILDGIAIASLGEVKSVFLAHRRPLAEMERVYCDRASLCSVNLLRVLLAERGLHPEFQPLEPLERGALPDFFLLIGDPALDFARSAPEHCLWDLGEVWTDLTRLPMVYAVWALRRDVETRRLRRLLREARDLGMDTLDSIIESRTEYDLDFRKDYLGWHIHYHLASDEKRGIARFIELLRRHGTQPVYEPRYVT